MNKLVTLVKWVGCTAVIVAGIYYAGKSDYEDAVLSEMKNNGTYYTMCQEHPDWDESHMVEVYDQWKKQRDEETRALRKRYDGRD